MDDIRKKLKKFSKADIYFLKSQWREWIKTNDFQKFIEVAQRPNVQCVYTLLEDSKVLYVENEPFDRLKARLKYQPKLDLVIVFKINEPLNRLEIITYFPETINKRKQQP